VSAPADERLGAPDDGLGLFATVAIVVGGIVGTGIFTVPAAIADYGWLMRPPSPWLAPCSGFRRSRTSAAPPARDLLSQSACAGQRRPRVAVRPHRLVAGRREARAGDDRH
jgi:hypothetical protein